MKQKLEYLLLLSISRFVCLFPLSFVRFFASFLADISFSVFRIRRKITLNNLRGSFPEKDENWIKRIGRLAYCNLAIALFEFFYFPRFTEKRLTENIKLQNPDVVYRAQNEGKGLILMSGHFGNWELLAIGATKLLDLKITIVVKKQKNSYVNKFINSLRTRYNNKVVPMRKSVREIIRILNEKGTVAMLADQSAPRDSVYVEFFGKKVATFQGPARFALRSGTPIVMGFAIRQSDYSYNVVFERIQTNDLTGSEEEKILDLTQRHTTLLEKYIREYPDHWLWQHRRWKNIKK